MLAVQPWCIWTRIEWESDGSLLLAGRNLISLMMMARVFGLNGSAGSPCFQLAEI